MQVPTIVALIAICVAGVCGDASCPGKWGSPNCNLPMNTGTAVGRNCRMRAGQMWAWRSNDQRCVAFTYLGCGGNANRFCSRSHCMSTCVRRPNTPTRRPTSRPPSPG